MGKFCTNCGKELKENADICLNCGIFINKTYKEKKVKIPGNGMSKAGMILGIISIFMVFCDLTEVISMTLKLSSFNDYYDSFADSIFDVFIFLGISITGLVLSAVSRKKIKNGFNMTGLILNSISILLTVILFVLILKLIIF